MLEALEAGQHVVSIFLNIHTLAGTSLNTLLLGIQVRSAHCCVLQHDLGWQARNLLLSTVRRRGQVLSLTTVHRQKISTCT